LRVTPKTIPKKESVYTLRLGVDIPIIAIGTGFTLYATTKIYTKGPSTEEQINNLNTSNINSFDRWAVTPYSKSMDKFSYIPFNASFAFPLVMLLVRDDTRQDFWKISFLYWEALSITGCLVPVRLSLLTAIALIHMISQEKLQWSNARYKMQRTPPFQGM
jgi:hypothetical protein